MEYWIKGIRSERKEHHKDTEWLKGVKKELEQDEGQDGWLTGKQCLSKRIRLRGILQVIINLLHAYP